VPPPRVHLVRYHGILAPCASTRDRVVPGAAVREHREDGRPPEGRVAASGGAPKPDPDGLPIGGLDRLEASQQPAADAAFTATERPLPSEASAPDCRPATRPRRLAWAELLRRVFAVDVLACPRCGGRMRVLAALHPPETTQAILRCLALPARAPPLRAARCEASQEAHDPAFDVEADLGA
jgi:hypothetical protein